MPRFRAVLTGASVGASTSKLQKLQVPFVLKLPLISIICLALIKL